MPKKTHFSQRKSSDKKRSQQRALGVLGILLIVLAILLFAVSRQTDFYGFAKMVKGSYSRRTPQQLKSNIFRRVTPKPTRKITPRPTPRPTAKKLPAGCSEQRCTSANNYCDNTSPYAYFEGTCIGGNQFCIRLHSGQCK